ncbi:hypothetical protein B0O80DRAFT_423237 [Mortierella sp. GBAus27b]|nr:hypothetical protein B0O80DRAFT_423237 [Mortierella sp. GBAus27b]
MYQPASPRDSHLKSAPVPSGMEYAHATNLRGFGQAHGNPALIPTPKLVSLSWRPASLTKNSQSQLTISGAEGKRAPRQFPTGAKDAPTHTKELMLSPRTPYNNNRPGRPLPTTALLMQLSTGQSVEWKRGFLLNPLCEGLET